MSTSAKLQATLSIASIVAGLSKSDINDGSAAKGAPKVLKDVLRARLEVFTADAANWADDDEPSTSAAQISTEDDAEEYYKLLTAIAALRLLGRLAQCEQESSDEAASRPSTSKASTIPRPPVFGLRDLKVIQTLASLVTRWAFGLLLEAGTLPAEMYEPRQNGRIGTPHADIARVPAEILRICLDSSLRLLLPDHAVVEVKRAVLPNLFLATLAALLASSQDAHITSTAAAERLLASVAPALAISSLLSLLAAPTNRAHVRIIPQQDLSKLLSDQLIRPGGVIGVLSAILARTIEEPNTQQYMSIAKVLTTPPSGVAAKLYNDAVWRGLLTVLRPVAQGRPGPPSTFIRAACFCVSRAVQISPGLIQAYLIPAVSLLAEDVSESLDLLTVIISNIEPSSNNYDALLTPLIPQVLSAWLYARGTKADPLLQQSLRNILETWGKTLQMDAIIKAMSTILEESSIYSWRRSDSGGIIHNVAIPPTEVDLMDLNIRRVPSGLVSWLKGLNRPRLLTKLMIIWLEEVQCMQRSAKFMEDLVVQKAVLLRLQLLQHVIDECGSDIVDNPQDTLIFIDHAIEIPQKEVNGFAIEQTFDAALDSPILGLPDLRITDQHGARPIDVSTDESENPDSVEAAQMTTGDQLTVTGLTLLLTVLEANMNLSVRDTPALASIGLKLELLLEHSGAIATRLAADARLVLQYRTAADRLSSTGPDPSPGSQLSKEMQLYLEALKLLQDPIIPIRAQGLSMLRDLASPDSALLQKDPALLSGILDLFIQTIQQEDSFIYLNAIRGLSSMVDRFGKDIAARLVEVYRGTNFDQVGEDEAGHRELDKRLRCGEALTQVVERAGTALATFGELLVRPALHILTTVSLPVVLRSSALTLLSACTSSAPLFMLQHLETLFDAMLDLLRLTVGKPLIVLIADESTEPLTTTPTHPSLRRAAILLLHQTLSAVPEHIPRSALLRLQTVLEYTRVTDADALVKHNAGTVCEDIADLL